MPSAPLWISCLTALAVPVWPLAAAEPTAREAAPPPIREVDADVFEIGNVRLDQKLRIVTFPATLNMTEGDLEYAIVGSEGKTHESLLRTDTQPYHLHLAMLLLGSKTASQKKPAPGAGGGQKPPEIIDSAYLATAPKLTGDVIRIEVAYEREGKSLRKPLEDLVWDAESGKAMARGDWLYNGSQFYEGKFCVQIDKSIAALITDPCALINHPGEGPAANASWTVRPGDVPPEGTPVTVTLKLTPAPERLPTSPPPKTQ